MAANQAATQGKALSITYIPGRHTSIMVDSPLTAREAAERAGFEVIPDARVKVNYKPATWDTKMYPGDSLIVTLEAVGN